MTLERRIAAACALDDAVWARHANPWSGWSRMTALPLLLLAGWSRAWIGWWFLLPLGLALTWTWYNPRLFPPPRHLDAWISRSVLGERLWLDRDRLPVPPWHRRAPNILTGLSAAGLALALWGVILLQPWPAIAGWALATLAKLWFLDRMAWLQRDMKDRTS